jgi:heme/copper-type cytochrome/quinol oxidase subunit 2
MGSVDEARSYMLVYMILWLVILVLFYYLFSYMTTLETMKNNQRETNHVLTV